MEIVKLASIFDSSNYHPVWGALTANYHPVWGALTANYGKSFYADPKVPK